MWMMSQGGAREGGSDGVWLDRDGGVLREYPEVCIYLGFPFSGEGELIGMGRWGVHVVGCFLFGPSYSSHRTAKKKKKKRYCIVFAARAEPYEL